MTRFAVVRNARDAKQLWAYLPANYRIVGGDVGEPGVPVYVIAGEDSHGWTLDSYVIPRLASGLIWAVEIDENAMPVQPRTGDVRPVNGDWQEYVAGAWYAWADRPLCSCEVVDDGDGESGPHLAIWEPDPNCPRHAAEIAAEEARS
jgi:hypothetical protein